MADRYTYGGKYICLLSGEKYERIAETIHGDTPEWDKHAGYLIKAANSHEALVEALQTIASRADGYTHGDDRVTAVFNGIAELAIAALAAAEASA